MSKYCVLCDKSYDLSLANYCPDCGTLLSAPPRIDCPECFWNQSSDNRFCIQCGADLRPGENPANLTGG